MSDSARSSPPLSDPPDSQELLQRFGRWCLANPVQAALLLGLLGTLGWYFVLYAPFVGGSQSTYRWGLEAWDGDNDLEHGPLILPGAILVAWLHRGDFAQAVKRPSWVGLMPLLFGCFLFVASVWTQQPRIALVSLPILILGCVWSLWGWQVTRLALLPCILLLFMVPLGFLLSHTEPLQRFVASVVTTMSNLVGIGVDRDGVKLLARDGSFKCEVAGGCSGIRSLMAMTMLSLLYVHFVMKEPWKKLVVFAMTLPFAVFGNLFRVFTIVLASKWFGESVGTGPWHNISGFIVTIPIAVGSMIFFGDLLNRDWSGLKEKILAKDEPLPEQLAPETAEKVTLQKSADSSAPAPANSPISYDY